MTNTDPKTYQEELKSLQRIVNGPRKPLQREQLPMPRYLMVISKLFSKLLVICNNTY